MSDSRFKGASRRDFIRGAAATGVGAGALSSASILSAINASAQEAGGEPIPVGSMVPLTGWGGADAIEFQRGVNMACEDINAVGGILGRPLEPHFEDTKNMTSDVVTAAARRLIDRFGVHAIINGYNSPSLRAEYDTIADAGVPYLHDNTDYGHHAHIVRDPDRYFSIFMCDPAEWYYGPAIMLFIDELEKSGKWTRRNNKLALLPGQYNYNTVIAQGIRENAEKFGWEIAVDEVVNSPVNDWGPALVRVREADPAIVLVIHTSPQDLSSFSLAFDQNSTNSLVYMQYGPQLKAYRDIAKETANGVFYSTVVGSLPDEIGNAFNKRYRDRFGQDASPTSGAQPYDSTFIWAIAAARAGGTGEPYEMEQNRKVCNFIRNTIYRGVLGTTKFFIPEQAAVPYPAETKDPSLGMPTQFWQVQDYTKDPVLVSPQPYTEAEFMLPAWVET